MPLTLERLEPVIWGIHRWRRERDAAHGAGELSPLTLLAAWAMILLDFDRLRWRGIGAPSSEIVAQWAEKASRQRGADAETAGWLRITEDE